MVLGDLTQLISPAVTGMFITLFGIRSALSLLGERNRTDFQFLTLYALAFSAILFVAQTAATFVAYGMTVVFIEWQFGSIQELVDLLMSENPLALLYGLQTLGIGTIAVLFAQAAILALFAVPIANAARSAGATVHSGGLFYGFGSSFAPLFLIGAVILILNFFFSLGYLIFALMPFVMSIISLVVFQTAPNIELETVLRGGAAGLALLWLYSWAWSAAAVALQKHSNSERPSRDMPLPPEPMPVADIRSLRKSRE